MQDIVFFVHEHIILVGIWFFCLISTVFYSIKNIFIQSKIINNFQAIKLINENHAIVIDTRSSKLFNQGHIVNSINISLKKIFLGDIKEIEMYKSFPIILILNKTYETKKCIKEFLKYGFNHIYILKNGIYFWNLDHLPLVIKDK